MRAWTLGSGSRGNALLLECDGTRVLIDSGFGLRALTRRLSVIQVPPESIAAVVVTHEHMDHARGVAQAQARWQWQVFGSAGTLGRIAGLEPTRTTPAVPGAAWTVGSLSLELLSVAHDAASPTAVLATSLPSGFRTGIAHDLGSIDDELRAGFRELDLLFLESNHDEEMLRNGPYPRFLQDRIAGRCGHLSNRQCALLAAELAGKALGELVLLHLSEVNNSPEIAVAAVSRVARGGRRRCRVRAAPQHEPAGPFGVASRGLEQLTLAL